MSRRNVDLGSGSVGKLLFSLAVPTITSQIVNMLYNLVDRVYIGHMQPVETVGKLALTGVGVCLPIIMVISAFAALMAFGGAPRASIAEGRGDLKESERIMGNSFTMLVAVSVVLTVVFLVFAEPMLRIFGASDNTIGYALNYMRIYALGTIFVQVTLGMNAYITAQGFTVVGMKTVLIGAILNTVLDPIFIFAFGMGVRGAALATILSQAVSAVWVLKFLTGRRALLRLRWNTLRLQAARVRRILALGTSGFVMSMTNSLVQVLCNASLQHYGGDLYVGVMTVINSIREVVSMPVQGITNGCQPVLGYNYGAGEYERVRRGIRFTTVLTVGYSVAAWALVMAVPELLIRIFNDEPELIAAGIPAFRLYFAAFFCMSFQFIGQSVFVGLGRSRSAVFFSLLRKAILNAPLTVLLAWCMGSSGVFTAEAVSQLVGGLACFVTMCLTVYRPLGRLAAGEGVR